MLIDNLSIAAEKQGGFKGRTEERFNFGKKLPPPLVLLVHAAEVGNEEGLLRIRFTFSTEVESVHDPVSEVDVRVATVKRRESRNADFIFVMTLRVLERVSRIMRAMGGGIETVYECIGKILFVVRARKRRGKGRRTCDDVIVEVYRDTCGEDFELGHS